MNIFELLELEERFFSEQEEKRNKFIPNNNIHNTNYYCIECGNPIDGEGRNITKKKLNKWEFMTAKPYMGNCCNPY